MNGPGPGTERRGGFVKASSVFDGWSRIQDRLVGRLPKLRQEELQLRASPDGWPVWAMISHLAATRVHWLCGVCREPGAETTPFDPFGEGWEDRLDVPRSSGELVVGLESSWRIVESCLERWSVDMLGETFPRERAGTMQQHSRSSVLTRLVMHDAFHTGEVSLVLGMHGLASLDPWSPVA